MRKISLLLIISCGFLVYSCASSGKRVQTMADPLDKKEFVLVNMFSGTDIDIAFEDGRFYGFSGVNRYFGAYKISGGKIELGQMGVTKMAGPEKDMDAETEYLRLLNEADTFSLKGGALRVGVLEYKVK